MRGPSMSINYLITRIAMNFVPSDQNVTKSESAMSAVTTVTRGMTLKDSQDAVRLPNHAASNSNLAKYENHTRLHF
jgi:hypothetical protein